MAIYNTKNYLREAIDSVINQTIGFEDNIQLILVNDGSTDGTKNVLLNYANKYPDNIILINQENQGQAAARNMGLKYVEGKYINFLDSDDYLSDNAMEEIYKFFSSNDDEIDVVSLPIRNFGRVNDEHILNYKFKETKIIDLKNEPNNPQLHVASSFIKFDAINELFLTNLIVSEDSNFINKILLKKQKLGVLSSTYYFYRKHKNFGSTLDNASKNVKFYNDRLTNHFLNLIEYSINMQGFVPKFIQYTLIYDLYWLINETKSEIFFTLDESDFMILIHNVLDYIDDDVIWNNPNLKYGVLKKFLFYLKFNESSIIPNNGVQLMVSNKLIDKLDYHSFWINLIDMEDNFLYIGGYLNSHFDNRFISICAVKKNDDGSINKYLAEYDGDKGKNIILLSEIWQFSYNFILKIPIFEFENSIIKICVNYHIDQDNNNFDEDNIISYFIKIGFKNSACISKECNYLVDNHKLLAFIENQFYIMSHSFKGIIKIN